MIIWTQVISDNDNVIYSDCLVLDIMLIWSYTIFIRFTATNIYARHCANHVTHVILFHSHSNPARLCIIISIVQEEWKGQVICLMSYPQILWGASKTKETEKNKTLPHGNIWNLEREIKRHTRRQHKTWGLWDHNEWDGVPMKQCEESQLNCRNFSSSLYSLKGRARFPHWINTYRSSTVSWMFFVLLGTQQGAETKIPTFRSRRIGWVRMQGGLRDDFWAKASRRYWTRAITL